MSGHPPCCAGHSCDRCSVCMAGVCCLTDVGQQLKSDLNDARSTSSSTYTVQPSAGLDAHGRLVAATARIMSSLQPPAPDPPASNLVAEMRAAIELGVVELRPLLGTRLTHAATVTGSPNDVRQPFEAGDASRTDPHGWADGPAGLTTGTSSVWSSAFDAVRRADPQHVARTPRPTRSCQHKEQDQ